MLSRELAQSAQLNFWAAVIASYFAAVAMTGLFRKFQVEYGHHASHRAFIRGNRKANRLYLDLATTFAFCQNGDEYRKEHNEHHDRKIFTTEHDGDAALLSKFGVRPGKSKVMLWLTLLANLVSPYFHAYFFLQRAKSAGLEKFDFLGDPSGYKEHWTGCTHQLHSRSMPVTALGLVYCAVWKSRLRPRLKDAYKNMDADRRRLLSKMAGFTRPPAAGKGTNPQADIVGADKV